MRSRPRLRSDRAVAGPLQSPSHPGVLRPDGFPCYRPPAWSARRQNGPTPILHYESKSLEYQSRENERGFDQQLHDVNPSAFFRGPHHDRILHGVHAARILAPREAGSVPSANHDDQPSTANDRAIIRTDRAPPTPWRRVRRLIADYNNSLSAFVPRTRWRSSTSAKVATSGIPRVPARLCKSAIFANSWSSRERTSTHC